MTKQELQQLAEKIVSGKATEEEIILYNRLCDLAETSANDTMQMTDSEIVAMEASLKQTILRNIGKGRVYHMHWFRWTVVAAMLLLLAGVGYFYLPSSHVPPPQTAQHDQPQRFKNDVLPGRPGAILTLANGQQIVLDSAANGALASEGGANVIKKENEIVYAIQKAPAEVVFNTITTPPGRQYQLTLSDGTAVWLNAGSSITYPTAFTGKQRTVQVTGEVYFEVAHNPSKPFYAEKGNVRVEVLGTHFNMNTYDDENALKVTLLEGAVRVVNAHHEQPIKPGQQAQVTNEKVMVANDVNLEEVMAWKNGRFLFSNTDIGQLMRQLSRWYDVEVTYDKEVKDLFYAEIPRNTKLSDVLRALELTGKVHFAIDGKKVTVMP